MSEIGAVAPLWITGLSSEANGAPSVEGSKGRIGVTGSRSCKRGDHAAVGVVTVGADIVAARIQLEFTIGIDTIALLRNAVFESFGPILTDQEADLES